MGGWNANVMVAVTLILISRTISTLGNPFYVLLSSMTQKFTQKAFSLLILFKLF